MIRNIVKLMMIVVLGSAALSNTGCTPSEQANAVVTAMKNQVEAQLKALAATADAVKGKTYLTAEQHEQAKSALASLPELEKEIAFLKTNGVDTGAYSTSLSGLKGPLEAAAELPLPQAPDVAAITRQLDTLEKIASQVNELPLEARAGFIQAISASLEKIRAQLAQGKDAGVDVTVLSQRVDRIASTLERPVLVELAPPPAGTIQTPRTTGTTTIETGETGSIPVPSGAEGLIVDQSITVAPAGQ
jgi:hypothetical protein